MPAQTGLSQLGNALLQGSGDYANIQLRRQQEERQRAQQIADLQDQRAYAAGQRDIERNLAMDTATIEILLKEGWLKPTDVRNPEAVRAAADARQVRMDETRTREAALPQKFQQEADYLGEQDVALAQVENELSQRLSEPQPGPPSPAEVRQIAIRMTRKPVPSDQEINDMIPAATEAIMSDRMTRWLMDKEDAKNQIQLLRSQRTALRQSLGGLLQQGFVPNRTPPPPSVSLQAPSSGPRRATPEEAAAAAGVGQSAPAPVAAPAIPAEYGGIMGLTGSAPAMGAALSDPVGALEIGARTALSPAARMLNLFSGGQRRAAEGDVARAAEMAGAVERFNQPSRPILNVPSFMNYSPTPRQALTDLPPLPPLRKAASQSPAFQFSNSYAPGN